MRSVRAATAAAIGLLVASHATPAGEPDAAVAAYLEAWNGAPAKLESALAPGFLDRSSLLPLDAPMLAAQMAQWRTALPDLEVRVLERSSAPGLEVLRLRLSGRPAEPRALVPLSGGTVAIEQSERLEIRDGRIASREATVDDWTLPAELLFVPPAASPVKAPPAATVARLGPGRFLESIAFAPDGTLFVSTGFDGGIVTIGRDGTVRPFARLDVGPGGLMMCLAFDAGGTLYASVSARSPEVHGIWRFERSGSGRRIAALPAHAMPNGLALDGRGQVLVADSFGGLIWRAPSGGGAAQPWLRHPLLTPRPLVGRFPGANGLQRAGDAVLISVSDRSLLLRVPIGPDGAPGEPEIVSGTLPGDDFAVAADGTVYVTTHPFNTVVRLTPEGRQTVIAGPAQGVIGPTAAAIGPDGGLYVATDGGLFRPLPGVAPQASVVRLRLGSR